MFYEFDGDIGYQENYVVSTVVAQIVLRWCD